MKKLIFIVSFLALVLFAAPQGAQAQTTVGELQAQIQQLLVLIEQLQGRLAQYEGQPQPQEWCHDFNQNIRFGSRGEEVRALQTALQKEGFTIGTEIGNEYFGEQTASAVVGFQQKYQSEVLAPYGLQYGTGFVGTTTRAKLNSLYGCNGSLPTPAPVPIPQPVSSSITVLSPNGGENWSLPIGDVVNFHSAGVERVNIDLEDWRNFTAGGPFTWRLESNLPVASAGKYAVRALSDLTPKVQPGDYFKVRVWDASDTARSYAQQTADSTDNYFSIVSASSTTPSITVTSPNGGEAWEVGKTYTIRWNAQGVEKVFARLIHKDDRMGMQIMGGSEGVSASTREYRWTVSESALKLNSTVPLSSNQYEISVSGGGTGGSSGYFSIVASSTQPTPPPAPAAAPEMVYPVNGQVLNHGAPHGYLFKVKPVSGASGYLFGFFQNGVMIYENWRDDKVLSANGEFGVWPSNPFYSKFQAGDLQVWARAWMNNQWSEARIITIKLVPPTAPLPSITVSIEPTTPFPRNIAIGSSDEEVLQFRLVAKGEDITIGTLTLTPTVPYYISQERSCSNVSDLKLFDAGSQIGATILAGTGSTSAGITCHANFENLNLLIPKDTTKILSFKVSIPNSAIVGDTFAFGAIPSYVKLTPSGKNPQVIYTPGAVGSTMTIASSSPSVGGGGGGY